MSGWLRSARTWCDTTRLPIWSPKRVINSASRDCKPLSGPSIGGLHKFRQITADVPGMPIQSGLIVTMDVFADLLAQRTVGPWLVGYQANQKRFLLFINRNESDF